MERWILTGTGVVSLLAFSGLLFGVFSRFPSTEFKTGMLELYIYIGFLPGVLLAFFIPAIGLTYLGVTLSFACLIEFRNPDRWRLRYSLGRLLLCMLLVSATMGATIQLVRDIQPGVGRKK